MTTSGPPRLLIRADANSQIGTGHVMRSLALAQAWQDAGGEVTFASAALPDLLRERLIAEGCALHLITATIGSPDDSQQLSSLIVRRLPDAIVIDGYQFGATYQCCVVETGLATLVIDDDARHERYFTDFVLNQNLGSSAAMYRNRDSRTRCLLGGEFTLLRREFRAANPIPPRNLQGESARILITMGGSDPHELTFKAASAIAKITDIACRLTLVMGPAYGSIAKLSARVATLPIPAEVVQNPPDLCGLFQSADVAISAAGSTTWELAALGVPTILIPWIDNQTIVAEAARKLGFAQVIDGGLDFNEAALQSMVAEALHDAAWRSSVSQLARSLVNRQGAGNVVDKLRARVIRLRSATMEDAELLWNWRLDPDVQQTTFSKAEMVWDQHIDWLQRRLTDSKCEFFIAESIEGNPIGQVRLEASEPLGEWTVSISVDRMIRGRGFAGKIVKQAIRCVLPLQPDATFTAWVRESNTASRKLFESCGFHQREATLINGIPALRYQFQKESAAGELVGSHREQGTDA